jgi:hypothetical protein
VPNSVASLVLFVVLLAPGLVYVIVRELRSPTRSVSSFRETASVAFGSIVFNGVAIALFSLVRVELPHHTPDIGQLVRGPKDYLIGHYDYLLLWALLMLLLACAMGGIAGALAPGWVGRFTDGVSSYSAWWLLNRGDDRPEGHTVVVGCELEDGSHLIGELVTLSTDVEESADRDVMLRAPIEYRYPNSIDFVTLTVSGLVVSARQIRFLTFTYVPQAKAEEVALSPNPSTE